MELIYPKEVSCAFCGNPLKNVGDVRLCSRCLSYLPMLFSNTCKGCGRVLEESLAGRECSECRNGTIQFDGGCSPFEFGGTIQQAIYKLKYDGDRDMAPVIGKFMAERLKKEKWDIDTILPVPLHEKRLSERGFNQSYLLAIEVGREAGIDVSDKVLARERYTESQATLSKVERSFNVSDAFRVMDGTRVKGRNLLLVDDIMTTGSTLNECSKVLKKSGALKVYCLTAAVPIHYSK